MTGPTPPPAPTPSAPSPRTTTRRRARVLPVAWPAALAVVGVTVTALAAFLWPFFVPAEFALAHGNDAPWLFAVLLGVLALVSLAEMTSGRLEAKTVTVLGVTAAAGGAMRVLSLGTAGLEPMFFVIIIAGRVLGPGIGFVSGSLALLTGALLTGGVGPWLPFQMVCAGLVGLGAGLLPGRAGGRSERWVVAAYALASGLLYGLFINLWFWPFLGTNAPSGMGFVPGESAAQNLAHYGVFYVTTSLGWDLPRGVLNAILVLVAGPALLRVFRRGARRAAFDADARFEPSPPVGGPSGRLAP